MQTNVTLRVESSVARLTLSPPVAGKPATMDWVVLDALDGALAQVEANADIRAVVLAGAGDKYFVVGANIAVLKDLDGQTMSRWVDRGHAVLNRLAALAVPSIARVVGYCLGGGLELAMACDLIVAGRSAKLGLPEARLGFVTGWGGAARLTARVGTGAARKLLLTGRMIEAEEAWRIGLVDELAADEAVDARVDGLLEEIRQCSPLAVREMKRLADSGSGGRPARRSTTGGDARGSRGSGGRSARPAAAAEYLKLEREASQRCVVDAETRRRVRAFLEKRP